MNVPSILLQDQLVVVRDLRDLIDLGVDGIEYSSGEFRLKESLKEGTILSSTFSD